MSHTINTSALQSATRTAIYTLMAVFVLISGTGWSAGFTDNLDSFDAEKWHLANGWSNGYFTDSGWRSDHADYSNGRLTITLDNQPCSSDPALCSGEPLASAEVRTNALYGYGTIEARLKAAKGDGLVTSFFKYTGPSDGNPADEIDFEFLGNDTTRVQLNYFKAGVGGNEVFIDLGFDASADFHTYTIKHSPGQIEWLVDGQRVHIVTGPDLPTYPGRVMLSLWAVAKGTELENWAGYRDDSILPRQAEYDYVKITEIASDLSDTFDSFNPDNWHVSNGWDIPYWTDNAWRADHVNVRGGEAVISLDRIPCLTDPAACLGKPIASGELRSNGFYGYGLTEARLKAARGDGVITAFFKYTGPSDGNAHNEVDFEFLGNNTRRVQLNYFVNGIGQHETFIDLGFDAAEEYHTYAIRQTESRIDWLIDGNVVHSATDGPFPDVPARVMFSVWAAAKGTDLENWAGSWNENQFPAAAHISDVSIRADGDSTIIEPPTTGGNTGGSNGGGVTSDDTSNRHAIVSRLSGYMLDVGNQSTANDAWIVLWSDLSYQANNGDHQRWAIEADGDAYRIRAIHTGYCLTLKSDARNSIFHSQCTAGAAQRWQIVSQSNGLMLASMDRNVCVSIENASTHLGAAIIGATCNVDAPEQQFRIDTFTSNTTRLPFTGSTGGNSDNAGESVDFGDTYTPPISARYINLRSLMTGKYVDILGKSLESGTNALQKPLDDSGSQTWNLKEISTDRYQLIAQHSHKCLGVANSSINANVQQNTCDTGGANLWSLENAYGATRLVNQASSACLAVAQNNPASDVNIATQACGSSLLDLWYTPDSHYVTDSGNTTGSGEPITPPSGPVVQLRNLMTGKYADVKASSTSSGADVVQSPLHSGDSQHWELVDIGNSVYQTVARHSGLCIGTDAATGSRLNVQQNSCDTSNRNLWSLEPYFVGYRLQSKGNNECLAVAEDNAASGITLKTQPCGSTLLDIWSRMDQ